MTNRKISLTDEENYILNNIDVIENKRKKLKSVYLCLIKYSQDNKLSVPVAKLYTIHKNSKSSNSKLKMSLAYFKSLISDLESIGLVVIDKTNRKYRYFIPRIIPEKEELNNDISDWCI